ncbi:MAG: hypothetical protein ACRCTG_16655 [Aestuariivirga sp.]
MTIEVKHATQATGTDAGNGEIRKAQWNESHAISMASGALLGRSTAGAGPAEEIAISTGLSLSAGALSAAPGTVIDAGYVHTDNNYTTTEKSKLSGIAAGAEVNVNADWNAISGDAQILNKPTLGTAAAAATTDFATAAQGAKADTALQPAAIGVSVQAYDADLTSWAAIAPSTKQDTLVSGTSIKTVNGNSLLGSGDLVISGGSSIPVSDEGTQITAGVTSLNFTGAGITASAAGNAVTVNVPGGGGSSTLTIQNKTAAYTVVAGDNGTIINCRDASFTVSLTAAATLGAGFNCWVWNTTSYFAYDITIDPAGAETIDGADTLILRRGEGVQIICDGTNWQTGDKKRMRQYAENWISSSSPPVASGSGSVAIGTFATASAENTLAIGSSTAATSNKSTAIGLNSSGAGAKAVTGSGAMALGGSYASGTDSFAAAVANNTSSYGATANNAIAIGYQARASVGQATAIGYSAQAVATGASAFGHSAYAEAGYSIALGDSDAIADYSVALGYQAYSAIRGKYAYASGQFSSAVASAQNGVYVLRSQTVDATPTRLTTNQFAAANNNQVVLSNFAAFAFTGVVVSRNDGTGTLNAAWKIEGLIYRQGTAGSTTLVTSTVTAISNAPGWTLALSADTSNGGLAVTFTGAAATNIRTVATIQTSEVIYA